jgi:membrane-associated phospholipid phosphatase
MIDQFSFYGNYFVSGIVFIHLLNQIPYAIGFIFFYIVNNKINEFLKMTIRENRPIGSTTVVGEKYEGAHKYGMPSGHAQTLFYALSFFFQIKKSVSWTIGLLFITSLTLYQRWKYKNHSIEQLAAGSLVGILVGIVAVEITKRAIQLQNK